MANTKERAMEPRDIKCRPMDKDINPVHMEKVRQAADMLVQPKNHVVMVVNLDQTIRFKMHHRVHFHLRRL